MEGKSYMSSFSGRKLVSVPQESSSQTTHLLLGYRQHIYCLASMKLKNCAIMNLWEGMDYNISKIADYAPFQFES